MDWLLDGSLLCKCESDLREVFRYKPATSRLVQISENEDKPRELILDDASLRRWFLEEQSLPQDFEENNEKPKESNDETITLLFSRRSQHEDCASLNREKSVKYLPFSYETFKAITEKLLIHSGISRVVSRGDVCVFSSGEVDIGEDAEPALVYHCRSSDYWPGDMALSVTHRLRSGRTSAIFFGTTPEIERNVLNRLGFAKNALRHPLLFPGIFAELERERQLKVLVEETQIDLESTISTLHVTLKDGDEKAPPLNDNTKTLNLWLMNTEIRNGLANWKTQLEEMLKHAEHLSQRHSVKASNQRNPYGHCIDHTNQVARVGQMVKSRLRTIIHEYDESIRDCTMRVDGMSMATQLWHAQSNMHIALDAKRDGKRIQNISMFSMVFLPSMFVATIFSTDFFNWFPSEGQAIISPYFWVLIVFSACLTLFILGGYYMLSSRVLSIARLKLKCPSSLSPV